jgi:hypothetical protein
MPRLRDGVIKCGGSGPYVIRVPDPGTGVSRPKWVGGCDTEEAAKAGRDGARVRARRGEFVNRSTSPGRGLLVGMTGGARRNRETEDARRIPARH